MRLNQAIGEKFEVRDMRIKEKFFVDDVYLNGYAKKCGPYASLVYFCLCRHVDKDQSCFPSIELMSNKLAISENTVKRAIKTLLDYKIIAISRKRSTKGTFNFNIYHLRDKSEWKEVPDLDHSSVGAPVTRALSDTQPGLCDVPHQGSVVPPKDKATVEGYTFKVVESNDSKVVDNSVTLKTTDPLGALPLPYVLKDDLARVVVGWKMVTGYKKEDREWDKAHWGRTAKTARKLLDFIGNWRDAVDCIEDIRADMTKKNLSCTIETVLNHSADWKLRYKKVVA